MRTFSIHDDIKPIWPETDKEKPGYILRKHGYFEDVNHNKTCEMFLEACEKGRAEIVKAYIKLGINIEFREHISKATPLTKAVEGDRTEVIKILVEAGADIEGRDGSDDTPLMTAINWTNFDSFKTLLKLGANPDAADKYNNSCLSKAFEAGDEYAELLLKSGADPDLFGELSESAMHLAINDEDSDRLELLLKAGGNPNLTDMEGLSLIGHAILGDSEESVKILQAHGADPEYICNGWSHYDIALFNDSDGEFPLPYKKKVDETTFEFLKAVKDNDINKVTMTIERYPGLDLNTLDFRKRNAVQIAMNDENYEMAVFLAEKGVDLSHRDPSGGNVIGYCTDYETVKTLLEHGASPNEIKNGKEVCELLSPALDSENPEFIKTLIKHGAKLDDLSHTNLTFGYGSASQESLAEAVKILAEAGADLEAPDDFEATLLINAVYSSKKVLAKALIDAGVNINAVEHNNYTPLHKACDFYDNFDEATELVRMLLDAGADYSILNWQYNSCHDLLVSQNNIDANEVLYEHMEKNLALAREKSGTLSYNEEFFKALIQSANYETFLHWVRDERVDIVKGLLDAGFNPNSPEPMGKQALSVAIERGNDEMFSLLLDHGADPNTMETYGNCPYYEVLKAENYDYLDLLIKNGLELNQADDWLRSRVSDAVTNGGFEMVKYLYENGASMELFLVGWSPFAVAADKEEFELCEFLLSKGANINIRINENLTPLIRSVNNEKAEMTAALLGAGAEVDLKNDDGDTPLIIAARKGNREIIKLLLDAGADPSIENKSYESALSLASLREELSDLFSEKAMGIKNEKKHTKVSEPLTPIFSAVYSQDLEDFEEVLNDPDTDVNETNYRGDTPLMIAVAFNNTSMINMLLEKGADVSKENMFKDTAWSYSFVYKDESIRKTLEKYGAKLDMDALNQWADQSMRRDGIIKSFKEGDIAKVVSFLDDKTLDINYLYSNQSPLEYAKSLNDFNMFKILMEKGADISVVVRRNPDFNDEE